MITIFKINLKKAVIALFTAMCLCFCACSADKSDTVYKYIDMDSIPEFSGEPYVVINNNKPYFEDDDYTDKSFEKYSELDSQGRCGEAFACIGIDIMPDEERQPIGQIKPAGWRISKYDNVDGKYLYNRCHLVGFQLVGENANEKNLITGTRYMNTEGMLPFENEIAAYVKDTGNHVLYRVTPIYEGDNLLCSGVLMEAYSVEDNGEGVCFNVYCYNSQPGITINYATGENRLSDGKSDTSKNSSEESGSDKTGNYIINKNSKKIHNPDCPGVKDIKPQNKKEYHGSVEDAENNGYSPCGICIGK